VQGDISAITAIPHVKKSYPPVMVGGGGDCDAKIILVAPNVEQPVAEQGIEIT
jgi:hypothetical protein